MNKLTPKQEKFCNLYVELGNASEAYRQSYSCKRMKTETVHRKAVELMANGKVTARVRELKAELKERHKIQKDDIAKQLVDIVNVNPLDFIKVENRTTEYGDIQMTVVKDLSELTTEQQKCVKSIQPHANGVKIEFYSRLDALDRLCKMYGLDEPTKHEVSGPGIQIEILDVKDKDK